MSIRTTLANQIMSIGRKLGRKDGESELAVFLSDHSIKTRMVDTDRNDLAWDDNLYRHGNLYLDGYANPIKPRVEHKSELQNSDVVDVDESDESHVKEDEHVDVISSDRYATYMKQQLIESLLNPREQWKLILYAVIGNVILTFLSIIVVLFATGNF